MDLARQIVVLVHLVGFAALLGGILVQARTRDPEVSVTMLWGGWAELGSGVACGHESVRLVLGLQ